MMRTALLLSGGGTTAEMVIRAFQKGELKLEPVVVLASKPDIVGIERAKRLGIETVVISPKNFSSEELFGKKLFEVFEKSRVEFVSQNGWLAKTPLSVIEKFEGKIINQHPGPLDPGRGLDFGGRGMYGSRVIAARVMYEWITGEDPWTEATTHFVTANYDEGDLIRAVKMKFSVPNTNISLIDLRNKISLQHEIKELTATVQKQLLPIEHKNVLETLRLFEGGKEVSGKRREEPLIPDKNKAVLNLIKELVIKLFPNG